VSLAAVQRFFAVYLRNPAFRESYRGGDAAALQSSLRLDAADVELLSTLDLDVLDRTAEGFRQDRIDKRWGEFSQFLSHLGAYVPPQPFLELWDRAFPEGLMNRPAEMDRFLTFASEYVVANRLPDYLLDLLRFCYHYTRIADAPVTEIDGALEPLPPSGLRAYHRLRLRGPFHVLACRHDALALAEAEPDRRFAQLDAHPVRLLIQKDRHRAKRTYVRHLDALPFVGALLDGDARQVSDLLVGLPARGYPDALRELTSLIDQDVLAVIEPPYMRAGSGPRRN
jgi:hypothetical protein